MTVKHESDLKGAEKLAFGGLCDAVGQLVAMVFDNAPGQTQRKIRQNIAEESGRIRLDILTDPLSVEVYLDRDEPDTDQTLYEILGTPDGTDCGRGGWGRPILPVALQKRYRDRL